MLEVDPGKKRKPSEMHPLGACLDEPPAPSPALSLAQSTHWLITLFPHAHPAPCPGEIPPGSARKWEGLGHSENHNRILFSSLCAGGGILYTGACCTQENTVPVCSIGHRAMRGPGAHHKLWPIQVCRGCERVCKSDLTYRRRALSSWPSVDKKVAPYPGRHRQAHRAMRPPCWMDAACSRGRRGQRSRTPSPFQRYSASIHAPSRGLDKGLSSSASACHPEIAHAIVIPRLPQVFRCIIKTRVTLPAILSCFALAKASGCTDRQRNLVAVSSQKGPNARKQLMSQVSAFPLPPTGIHGAPRPVPSVGGGSPACERAGPDFSNEGQETGGQGERAGASLQAGDSWLQRAEHVHT